MLQELSDYGFSTKLVAGCYKGNSEISILVNLGSNGLNLQNDVDTLTTLARRYSQESILVSYSDRTCHLIDCNTEKPTVLSGVLRRIDKSRLAEVDGYTNTEVDLSGDYWAVY